MLEAPRLPGGAHGSALTGGGTIGIASPPMIGSPGITDRRLQRCRGHEAGRGRRNGVLSGLDRLRPVGAALAYVRALGASRRRALAVQDGESGVDELAQQPEVTTLSSSSSSTTELTVRPPVPRAASTRHWSDRICTSGPGVAAAMLAVAVRGTRVRRSLHSWTCGTTSLITLFTDWCWTWPGGRGLLRGEVEPALVQEHQLEDGLGEGIRPLDARPDEILAVDPQVTVDALADDLELSALAGLGEKTEDVV